jgi:hypothetical protein
MLGGKPGNSFAIHQLGDIRPAVANVNTDSGISHGHLPSGGWLHVLHGMILRFLQRCRIPHDSGKVQGRAIDQMSPFAEKGILNSRKTPIKWAT